MRTTPQQHFNLHTAAMKTLMGKMRCKKVERICQFKISDFSVQVLAMTKTSATCTTTAFNIFLSKCREEQKVMFPKEKLGKPNTH